MIALEIVLCCLALAVLAPSLVLTAQVLMAFPADAPRDMPAGRRPSLAVLVPAHDEALVIADTLNEIVPQLIAGDRLLVVADNCADDTATIAAAAGAAVLERV